MRKAIETWLYNTTAQGEVNNDQTEDARRALGLAPSEAWCMRISGSVLNSKCQEVLALIHYIKEFLWAHEQLNEMSKSKLYTDAEMDEIIEAYTIFDPAYLRQIEDAVRSWESDGNG